jgi:N-carbamoylputrescine amidase
MKVALIVPRLTSDAEANLDTMERMAGSAASMGAGLIVLPEAVLTGLVNTDDPAHDIPLCQTIPGPATDMLGVLCSRYGCRIAFGLLELSEGRIYDSALLLEPDGRIGLTYRRISPGWHGEEADPGVYCQGVEIPFVRTPFGRMAFLLCGDLFDDETVSRFRGLSADWMLFPFARSFPDGEADQERWDREELPEYAARVALAKTPALMVNYITDDSLPDDRSFGGAFVISRAGEVLASHPLGLEGKLLVELEITPDNRVQVTRPSRERTRHV